MGFTLLPATIEDLDEITLIFISAFSSPRHLLMTKNVPKEELHIFLKGLVRNRLELSDPDTDVVSVKLVDERSGEVAAYAQWGFSGDASKKEKAYIKTHPITPPENMNVALRNRFGTGLYEMEVRNWGVLEEDYFELLDLATLPKFKRLGAGSQLIAWGLERADRERKVAVLSASPQGLSLYRKLGFVERDELRIDLGGYGGVGVHVHVAMVREPKRGGEE